MAAKGHRTRARRLDSLADLAHGGTIFGPQPRDYSYKMPKKAWRRALCLALSDRAANGKLVVVESLELAEPKTKAAKAVLDALGVKHALIVTGRRRRELFSAPRATSRRTRCCRWPGSMFTTCSITTNCVMTEQDGASAIEARLREGEPARGSNEQRRV